MEAAPSTPADRGILDVVLALHHAPALRFELRERPLPDDVDLILRLAAPSQTLLNDHAARLGTTAATLLEAARFYVEQVLFEPGTDAYRILGASPGDPQARLRDHHHWLQRWLHPDRGGDAGESPFAARINWAWQQLRNERQRAAYDATRTLPVASPEATRESSGPPRAVRWTTVPATPATHPGRWWRRGAVLAALGCCALLLYLALTRGGPLAPTPAGEMATAPDVSAPVDDRSATVAALHLRAVDAAPQPLATPPARPAPAERVASVTRTPARDVHTSTPRTEHEPRAPATLPRVPTLRTAVVIAPVAPVATHPFAPAGVANAFSPPLALAKVEPTSEPAAATPAAPAPPPDPQQLLHRVELARQRVNALVAYFRSHDDSVLDWRHAPAPYNAPLQRAALRQRHGLPSAATFALDKPVWRMDDEHIAMDADYHVHQNRDVIEQGRLSVRMVWQGGTWQVTRIQLEPRG